MCSPSARTDGDATMRELLGGRHANLAELVRIGLPVPPGFTISTEVRAHYYDRDRGYPLGLEGAVRRHLASFENELGERSATSRTRCWRGCAPVPGSPCPAWRTPSSTRG